MIPKKVRIGKDTYTVKHMRVMSYYGDIEHTLKEIRVAARVVGLPLPLTNKDKYLTFWHEAVHGILNSMGKKRLNNDERFVEELAQHIAQIVRPRMFPKKRSRK